MKGRKRRFAIFRVLPTEIIVLVMCHTRSGDLANLIQTDNSMNEIFQNHKMWLFKRMQICQFSEFSGWFGDMPGFDGPILGNNRTSEQIQCLKDVVFTFDWRITEVAPSDDEAAKVFLHLLERYGGWRYLYFLNAVKRHMEQEAQSLYKFSHMAIPSMNEESAKAMVLCFARMSWRAATVLGGKMKEPADMSARVEYRLKFFQREPRTLQKLMTKILRLLIYRIGKRLQVTDTVTLYQYINQSAGFGILIPVPSEEELYDSASAIMTRLLLECCFFYGITFAMQLCEEPVNEEVKAAQSWIIRRFEHALMYATRFSNVDTVLIADSSIREGSLWAAGIGFPTLGWFRSNKASAGGVMLAFEHDGMRSG